MSKVRIFFKNYKITLFSREIEKKGNNLKKRMTHSYISKISHDFDI